MKTLVLVRHAKSTWKELALNDIDRPLNERGIRDAYTMGSHLNTKLDIQAIHSSTATRAIHTALIFSRAWNFPKDQFFVHPELYDHSGSLRLSSFISNLPKDQDRVALFGHSPTFQMLAEHFSGQEIDHFPTCIVCILSFQVKDWKDIESGKGELKIVRPSDLFQS